MEEQNQTIAAVIVAAGRGSRAGPVGGPKQYQDLGGAAVLTRTLRVFASHPGISSIVVVRHPDDSPLYEKAMKSLVTDKLRPSVVGGATRQMSVAAGLQALESLSPQKVLVHDAARPFVSAATISRVIDALQSNTAVLPALPVADTMKRCDDQGRIVETVSRDRLVSAQTPQGFDYSMILKVHRDAASAGRQDFSDDTGMAEWAGQSVFVVDGNTENAKLTTSEDMALAREGMAMKIPDIRVGHGYDTHQFVDGNSIWLCGVKLPHDKSLSGHSDADVGLHALTDALLATIADGDIGSHFPPSDPQWAGASSDQFLLHAVSRVTAAGGRITHMDVTLISETPKIGPHRDKMRQAISTISGIETDRISVKATTNERIGFVGRNEGMVALATATVVMESAK
ncbi:MAG: bifunctional 2-C-methyl-D-erythritol 4-phosphate cytidylyltransferase/2-C-methyl-D-erythritol 2,4-cyclodiphosphate synthase [Rhizobiaceae bacterium]